jgi:hypothetical protein
VVPFLDFPPDVRKVIYTTNAIESLNSTLRKLLQYRGHFPTDEAVYKLLYLALPVRLGVRPTEIGSKTMEDKYQSFRTTSGCHTTNMPESTLSLRPRLNQRQKR